MIAAIIIAVLFGAYLLAGSIGGVLVATTFFDNPDYDLAGWCGGGGAITIVLFNMLVQLMKDKEE